MDPEDFHVRRGHRLEERVPCPGRPDIAVRDIVRPSFPGKAVNGHSGLTNDKRVILKYDRGDHP
jgi:hypothetical protein